MKTLNVEYLLLPDDGSHIQQFLYKFIQSNKINAWHRSKWPRVYFDKLGANEVIGTFAKGFAAISFTEPVKIKLHECKIVRKNVRKSKDKSSRNRN